MYRLKKNHVSIKEIANFLDYNYLNEDFFVEQVSTIDNITHANIKVATTPAHANHAASKQYVDSTSASNILIAGDDSSVV